MTFRKLTYSLLLLLTALVCITSCKSDEVATVELSSDCYISHVSLGQVKRAMLGGSTGDSVYYVRFSAAGYTMTINQHFPETIENQTPLPYNTQTDAILLNIQFKGTLVYQYEGDETVYPYSSSDSIDCSRPVIFTVYSSDGSSKRDYKMTINVYQEDAEAFPWQKVCESELLMPDTIRRAQLLKGQLIMLGCYRNEQQEDVMTCYRWDKENSTWTSETLTHAEDYDLQTLTLAPDSSSLLMSSKHGALLQSPDGLHWEQIGLPEEGLRLIGASERCLYSFKQDGQLYSLPIHTLPGTATEPLTWKLELTDAAPGFTPLYQPHLLTFHQESGYTRLVLVGYGQDDEQAKGIVWSKAWRAIDNDQLVGSTTEDGSEWMSFTHTSDNHCLLPAMKPLFVMPYDNGIVAFGDSTATQPALSTMYFSPDYGLSWKPSLNLNIDKALSGTTDCLAAVKDQNEYIWIIAGQETWRGRLNRLGYGK